MFQFFSDSCFNLFLFSQASGIEAPVMMTEVPEIKETYKKYL